MLTLNSRVFVLTLFEILELQSTGLARFNLEASEESRHQPSGVDFKKFGRTVQIIEIALSICALHLRPTFREAFYWRKSLAQGRKA